jgi:hypothetical protein
MTSPTLNSAVAAHTVDRLCIGCQNAKLKSSSIEADSVN